MLSKLKKPNQEGFTIIEVLIVLAIAGLILLIVFLAVPALQRSSRNTNRKNDASAVLGAINEYESNNAGALPTNAAGTTTLTFCNASPCSGTDAESTAKLGYYSGVSAAPASGKVTVYTTYTAPPANTASTDELIVEEQSTCTSATSAALGTSRAIAVVYAIESNGSTVWQCTGS